MRINARNWRQHAVGGLRIGLRYGESIDRGRHSWSGGATGVDDIDEAAERVDDTNVGDAVACRGWCAGGKGNAAGDGIDEGRLQSAAGVHVVHQSAGRMD